MLTWQGLPANDQMLDMELHVQAQGNGDLSAEDMTMPPRFSGKVSGILDDLSDAMSMLKDLLPSAHSDLHIQVRISADPQTFLARFHHSYPQLCPPRKSLFFLSSTAALFGN